VPETVARAARTSADEPPLTPLAASAVLRRRLLFETFAKTESDAGSSPFAVLVKRLQESLSRMETFEVTTAYAGSAADGASLAPVASSRRAGQS